MKKTAITFLLLLCFSNAFSQEITQLNKTTLDDLFSSNKGKPVLINLWATWCKPCVEEFPELLKIQKEYESRDLKVILISLDFGDDAHSKTTDFLKKMGVEFETYSNSFSSDEDLINYFDLNWNGAIPATFIYDRDGKLNSSMIGKRPYDVFRTEVEKVM